jgi:PAS domain S-box-containing protein
VDPVLIQAGLVVPLTLGLSARILLRPRNGPVHWLLAGLLASLGAWVAANAVSELTHGSAVGAGGIPALVVGCPLTVLFLLTMAFHARIALFENSRAMCIAACVPFVCLGAVIATNSWHHLVFVRNPSLYLPASVWAGPFFWVFQIWSYAYMLTGLAFLLSGLRPSAPRSLRRQTALILAASTLPLLAHSAALFGWLGLGFPLTPAAMGISAVLVVVAIDRYALLDAQPMVQRDVIEQLHDGVVLSDADGVLFDVNRAGERILGDRRDNLRGRLLGDVLRRLARPGEGEALLWRLAEAERGETEVETADGRRVEIRSGSVRTFSDQPAGRFLVLRDRTEQWRHQQLLQQRQRLESVGILAAGVAHEVNNPLAFVRANLAHLGELAGQLPKLVAPDASHAPGELLEMGDVVAESIEGLDRIARIVESLLHFARSPREDRRAVSLVRVAEEALRFAALHRGQPLRVETDFSADLPPVEASEDRLVQVVLNLLLNARHTLAAQPDGWIRVEASAEGRAVVLRVRDNGPGVPDEIRERIFDPFFTTRRPGEGTGLGLSIAFDIVREHDGTLELEGRGPGACFALRLPASPAR